MRVGVATVQVPFVTGGAEIHARLLLEALLARGHQAEIITIPFRWDPPSQISKLMEAARNIDLSHINGLEIERLITMKFPMYLVKHHHKVGWILHQHRQAYELYGTPHSDLHLSHEGMQVANEIKRQDRIALAEHKKIFTNSQTVANRLWQNNRLHATALYHPPEDSEKFYCGEFSDYILVPGRLESIKRQQLILDAVAQHPSLRLVVIGNHQTPYGEAFIKQVAELNLQSRVTMKGFVSREDKLNLYANALAVYNGAFDEDYGYITLEAFFAGKPLITHTDSGGPLEFVKDGVNGFITAPEPCAIAAVLADLNNDKAMQLGAAGRQMIEDLDLNWDHIIDTLLGSN